jgi:PAS domain S-box-containing protein
MNAPTRTELATILDGIHTAVVAVDDDWRFTYFNPAADALVRQLGRSAEGLLGKTSWIEFPELLGTVCQRELQRAAADRVRVAFDTQYAPLDRWLRVHATPTAGGLTVSLEDVTARKHADRSRRDLLRAEGERERLLESERAARAEAEAANRSKDEFLAILSHELRTPLTAVLGWARMLRTARLDEAGVTRALEAIDRNTNAQIQLINDLLDVSRIVTGKLEMQREPVAVVPAIESALESVAEAAERKRITIDTSLDGAVGLVVGDDMRLCQIVTNLVGNAVKFTPEDGRVSVRLDATGDEVVITVADTGIGIAPEDLPRVFNRFHQGQGPHRTSTGGLGLGLAIVQHLVKQHGGRVTAHSDGPGTGARFSVALPRVPGSAGPGARRRLTAGPPADADLTGVVVLVIEDDPDTREIIGEILRERGGDVRTADSAEAALARLADEAPDVIVSDIGMARLDGFGLMRRVRALPAPVGRVPAIALTAYARLEDRASALAAGYQVHLTKPVEPSELRAAVGWLAKGRRRAAADRTG